MRTFRLAPSAALLIAGFLLAAPSSAAATRLLLPLAREGPWLAPDRQLHFAGSLAVAASLRVQGRDETAAFCVTISAGALKELYDALGKPSRSARGASRKDFVADLAGAAVGILLVRAADR